MPKKKPSDPKKKPQHQRFKEFARKVGIDESSEKFARAFEKAVPAKTPKRGKRL